MKTGIREALEPGQVIAGSWAIERPLAEVGGLVALLARGLESGRAILFILPDAAPDPVLDEDEAARWGTVRRVLRDEAQGRVVIDEVPEGGLLAERLALGMPPAAGLIDDLSKRLRACHRTGGAHGQLAPDRIVLGPEAAVVAGWGLGGEHVEQRRSRDLAWIARLAALSAPVRRPAEAPAPEPEPAAVIAVPPTPVPAGEPADTLASPAREVAPTEPVGDARAAGAPDVETRVPPEAETRVETNAPDVESATGPPTGTAGAAATHRLQAAIVSDHVPTLAQALDEWERDGGAADDPIARRGRDALSRLQKKVENALGEARQRLAAGDPLGAVTPCREAIRLGAEAEAEPLLNQARRQARQLVSHRRLPSPRVLAYAAGAAVVVLLLVAALIVGLRPDRDVVALRAAVQAVGATRGERAAVLELLARRDRGDDEDAVAAVLGERLQALPGQERDRLTKLRREAVAQGARPREADLLSDQALARLAEMSNAGPAAPGLRSRLQQAFMDLDRAAALYRTSASVGAVEAARGVDGLLAVDPVFAGGGR